MNKKLLILISCGFIQGLQAMDEKKKELTLTIHAQKFTEIIAERNILKAVENITKHFLEAPSLERLYILALAQAQAQNDAKKYKILLQKIASDPNTAKDLSFFLTTTELDKITGNSYALAQFLKLSLRTYTKEE